MELAATLMLVEDAIVRAVELAVAAVPRPSTCSESLEPEARNDSKHNHQALEIAALEEVLKLALHCDVNIACSSCVNNQGAYPVLQHLNFGIEAGGADSDIGKVCGETENLKRPRSDPLVLDVMVKDNSDNVPDTTPAAKRV